MEGTDTRDTFKKVSMNFITNVLKKKIVNCKIKLYKYSFLYEWTKLNNFQMLTKISIANQRICSEIAFG